MGYVFDFKDAKNYEQWFNHNRLAAELQSRVMIDLLNPFPGETILDIGCGTGISLRPLLELGLSATGIDPSPYMLDIAAINLGNRVDLHRGFAEDLPFDDNSFNYACMVTTLEFVDDPQRALEEAFRVAKNKVFLGFLNQYAIKSVQRRVKGWFSDSIYNQAQFFSIWELKRKIRSILGDPPISWRTVCHFPSIFNGITHGIERWHLTQRCPFGAFAGMVVTIVPRYRTRPLTIRYQAKPSTGAMTG
jgi:SAM-dependent methyltransferase